MIISVCNQVFNTEDIHHISAIKSHFYEHDFSLAIGYSFDIEFKLDDKKNLYFMVFVYAKPCGGKTVQYGYDTTKRLKTFFDEKKNKMYDELNKDKVPADYQTVLKASLNNLEQIKKYIISKWAQEEVKNFDPELEEEQE